MKYTKDKKKLLANKIMKLKNKEDFINVYKIISNSEDIVSTKQGGSLLMLFHTFKDETYKELDIYVKKVRKAEKESYSQTEESEYKPYSQDEFPSQKSFTPKLKYSNREKNLIKRKRYDTELSIENGTDVTYKAFNIDDLTESEYSDSIKSSQKKPETTSSSLSAPEEKDSNEEVEVKQVVETKPPQKRRGRQPKKTAKSKTSK